MKTPSRLCLSAALLVVSSGQVANAQTPAAAAKVPAPLGLLRLETDAKPGQAPALAVGKYAVDDLAAGAVAGATKTKKDNVDVLTLDAGREWSRSLRGSPREVSFVSF